MKRVVDRGAWFLALGGLVGLSACTDANESLIVLQAQVPDDECVISDKGEDTARLESGILDVALNQLYSYKLFPLVQNNLKSVGTGGRHKSQPGPGHRAPG